MNIHGVYNPFLRYFRAGRLLRFYNSLDVRSSSRVLDVGGNMFFWDMAAELGLPLPQLTILNLDLSSSPPTGGAHYVIADGRELPFDDLSFDAVFSNSVIEHLANWESQLRFAAEIRRVAPSYFVQTPDYRFVIEPHLLTPFIHYLPPHLQKRLIRNFTVWGLITRPSVSYCERFLAETKLMGREQLVRAFPDARVISETFLRLPKSLIAVRS